MRINRQRKIKTTITARATWRQDTSRFYDHLSAILGQIFPHFFGDFSVQPRSSEKSRIYIGVSERRTLGGRRTARAVLLLGGGVLVVAGGRSRARRLHRRIAQIRPGGPNRKRTVIGGQPSLGHRGIRRRGRIGSRQRRRF